MELRSTLEEGDVERREIEAEDVKGLSEVKGVEQDLHVVRAGEGRVGVVAEEVSGMDEGEFDKLMEGQRGRLRAAMSDGEIEKLGELQQLLKEELNKANNMDKVNGDE